MRIASIIVLGTALCLILALLMRDTPRALAADAPTPAGVVKIGQTYSVYLRADATGVSYPNRLADLSNLIQKTGKITAADDDWLVLKEGEKEYTIPTASIALLEAK